MERSTSYPVSLQRAVPRTIAAVHTCLLPSRIPGEFKRYLDQVHAARGSGLQLDGQNIFVYRNAIDQPNGLDIEFGVGIKLPSSISRGGALSARAMVAPTARHSLQLCPSPGMEFNHDVV